MTDTRATYYIYDISFSKQSTSLYVENKDKQYQVFGDEGRIKVDSMKIDHDHVFQVHTKDMVDFTFSSNMEDSL